MTRQAIDEEEVLDKRKSVANSSRHKALQRGSLVVDG
jgi:hypothetical protein